MPLPKPYQHQPSTIASYDYADIFAGAGVIENYGGLAGTSYILSDNKFYSGEIYTASGGLASTSFVEALDIDFDVYLNRSLTLGGRVVVNAPIHISVAGGGTNEVYIIAKVREWDGTTETEIASGTGNTFTTTASAYHMLAAPVNIPANTIIKRGNYLRLTIGVWAKKGTGSTYVVKLGHDPMNSTDAVYTGTSILTFQVPVKIDL